ncbi:MAG: hypothetical protein KGJ35_03565 [Patescibacteria group bacterium]|nr:hypothetical protein [Patescibacteria group bacterium]
MIQSTFSLMRQALVGVLVLAVAFILVEPAMGEAQAASSQFTVSQQVNAQIAFATPASNVTMSPALGGLTGGTSNGSTQVVVVTNDLAGYSMTLQASSSLGMINTASSTYYIQAYKTNTANVPDYTFGVNSPNTAAFGYNVTAPASNSGDVAALFKNNGSGNCNTGSTVDGVHCWLNSSTTPVTIVNRTAPTLLSGATTTINFQVTINPNPNPMIASGTYISTTTLTATPS